MLHVPFRLVKRGGRKEMQLPEGATQPDRTDSSLVKALARAFRWKRMLESGEFATIAELAAREGIAPSYMTRVLRLTLLAPNIVDAILDGKQVPGADVSAGDGAISGGVGRAEQVVRLGIVNGPELPSRSRLTFAVQHRKSRRPTIGQTSTFRRNG